jgi:large exoprotein involved in heme utilization and adhesion
VRIRGGVLVADNSTIDASNTTEQAAVGGIDLRADAARLTNSRIVSDALGAGSAGSITVAAGTLEVRDGSAITSNTHASGAGGTVSVQADSMVVSGGSLQIKTVISSDVIKDDASGEAEGVTITAGTLEVRDNGVVSSDTLGRGRGGTVTIEADHLVVTSGDIQKQVYTRISSRPQPLSTGAGGSIKITAGAVEVSDGAVISTSTLGTGNAGNVIIHADSVMISGGGAGIFSASTFPNNKNSPSQAGVVQITAGELEVSDGGGIGTDTGTAGSGGTVTIRADHLVVASGRPESLTRISSRTYWTGNGGTVEIMAGTVEVLGEGMMSTTPKNAHISTSAFNSGHAGNVIIDADAVVVSGSGGEIASRAHGTGNGGGVVIFARAIRLSNGGVVNTESTGRRADAGVSGPIEIEATDTLQLDQGSIQTRTETADGGAVTLTAGRLLNLHDSKITTSVAGGKSGGVIQIKSPLMVLGNSEITANAIGGNGGDIFINAGQLIQTPDSKITASGRVNGNITITAPNTDVAGSLVVLPETFFDVSSQLRETCAVRGGRPASSFSAGGRGGLPPDPGAPLAASPFGQPLERQTATGAPTALTAKPRQGARPITVSGIPQPVLGSPRPTCRG